MSDYVSGIVADWNRERPGLDTSPIELTNRLLRAGQLVQARIDEVVGGFGLSHKGDLDVLTALRRSGEPYEQTPSRLARGLQLTTGGMTNRLDRLEHAELILRGPDPSDRRGVLVRLTEHGKRVVDEALDSAIEVQDSVLGCLSKGQRTTLSGILEELLIDLGDVAPE